MQCVEWLFPKVNFKWLAEEIRKNLPKELDFQHEARNMDKASSLLKHLSFLKVNDGIFTLLYLANLFL